MAIGYASFPGNDPGWDALRSDYRAEHNIAGDLEIIACIEPDTWNYNINGIVLRYSNESYALYVGTSGIVLRWYDGSSFHYDTGPKPWTDPGVADGEHLWVRVTLDVDNGASGHDVNWYYSQDAIETAVASVSWTAWDNSTTAGTTSINAESALWLGMWYYSFNSEESMAGKIYVVEIYDGIGGTAVIDPDFRDKTQGDWESLPVTDDAGTVWSSWNADAAWSDAVDSAGQFLHVGMMGVW